MSEDVTIFLRRPAPDKAELVMSWRDHTCKVYSLDFDQVRMLNSQAAEAIRWWPVTKT